MGRGKPLEELEEYLVEAVSNIRDDRAVVATLLTDLIIYMKKDQSAHKECGLVASKYVETLQRSNEQLVKIAALLHKKESQTAHNGLTDNDREELFDIIKRE